MTGRLLCIKRILVRSKKESVHLLTLKKDKEFKRIYKKGLKFYGKIFKVYVLPGKSYSTHYGISIRKKIGKAVKRNRIRRLIKEVLRKNEGLGLKGYDYIIVVRSITNDLSYGKVGEDVEKIFKKIKERVKGMKDWGGQ